MEMRGQIKQMLFDTIMEVVTTTFLTMPIIKEEEGNDEFNASSIIAFVGLVGNLQGNIYIAASEKSASSSVSKILSSNSDNLQEDVFDSMGELTNVIAGGLKKKQAAQDMVLILACPRLFMERASLKW